MLLQLLLLPILTTVCIFAALMYVIGSNRNFGSSVCSLGVCKETIDIAMCNTCSYPTRCCLFAHNNILVRSIIIIFFIHLSDNKMLSDLSRHLVIV